MTDMTHDVLDTVAAGGALTDAQVEWLLETRDLRVEDRRLLGGGDGGGVRLSHGDQDTDARAARRPG